MKPDTDTLRLENSPNDWVKVAVNGEHIGYASDVKIAGNTLNVSWGVVEIEVTEWELVEDHAPALLIESAEWYAEPEGEE